MARGKLSEPENFSTLVALASSSDMGRIVRWRRRAGAPVSVPSSLEDAARVYTKLKHRLDDRELVGRKLELRTRIPRASQHAVDDALTRGRHVNALCVLKLSTGRGLH